MACQEPNEEYLKELNKKIYNDTLESPGCVNINFLTEEETKLSIVDKLKVVRDRLAKEIAERITLSKLIDRTFDELDKRTAEEIVRKYYTANNLFNK